MQNFIAAKTILNREGINLVLMKDDRGFQSSDRGIRALLAQVTGQADWEGATAADRIVGKASAMLYTILGVKEVYAAVLSKPGRAVLEQAGIYYEYGTLTDNIINRAGTGLCPMEDAVKDIDDPALAVEALRKRVAELAQGR